MPASQPLTSLPQGGWGSVTDLQVPADDLGRLMELGFLVGTPIELVRFAPLGDPVEIRIRGSLLTLPRHEADQIWVSTSS